MNIFCIPRFVRDHCYQYGLYLPLKNIIIHPQKGSCKPSLVNEHQIKYFYIMILSIKILKNIVLYTVLI